MSSEAIVTMPPDVVRTRASSTVFVKASKRVNLDLAGIFDYCSVEWIIKWPSERLASASASRMLVAPS